MAIIDDIKVLTGNKKTLEEEKVPMPAKKILIVEDEKPLLAILEERFTSEGFTVYKATNGKEGLDMVIAQEPQVIILDLMMPVMDGKMMLRRVREIPKFKRLPVIVLTNAGEVENIQETVRFSDAIEFLIKSNVTMDDIVAKVKRYVW